ncbi:MAG: reverse transcriptase family protein [Campylobacterales bacterium]|nr:reverse transcriptase family protein [Campylobacterales bacterium]
MKTKIYKSFFNKILVNNNVPKINSKDIKEFTIGKSYFYAIQNKNTKELLENLNKIILNKIELNNASIGFKKGYSYLHLFEPHIKSYNFLRLDIRSFFHSFQIEDIQKTFKSYIAEDEYIDDKNKQSLLDAFINLVTYTIPNTSKNERFKNKQVLPMGFPTSPLISNIVFRKLDLQIQKLCAQENIIYTRYADDMLFSSNEKLVYVHSENFINEIRIILHQMKFILNKHKTIKSKHTLSLNGYTIQNSAYKKNLLPIKKLKYNIFELRLSNKKTYIIEKMIHKINVEKLSSYEILKKLFKYEIYLKYGYKNPELIKEYNDTQLMHRVLGYRSYLISIIKFNEKYKCTQSETINKYLKIINKLDDIIEYRTKLE